MYSLIDQYCIHEGFSVVAVAVAAGPLLSRTDKCVDIYQSFIPMPVLCQFFRGEHMEDFLFGLLSSVFCYVNVPHPISVCMGCMYGTCLYCALRPALFTHTCAHTCGDGSQCLSLPWFLRQCFSLHRSSPVCSMNPRDSPSLLLTTRIPDMCHCAWILT